MGHIRVGRLPKVRGWKQVITLLDSVDSSAPEIAAATARAAKEFFSKKKADPGLSFSYWLLTQITFRARKDDFTGELKKIGLDTSKVQSSMGFLSSIASFSREQAELRGASFPLSDFAQLSLREVLTETIGQESESLFGTTQEDVKTACRRYSTPRQFSKLARLYFSKVLNRALRFFVAKESSNNVGAARKFEDVSEVSDFYTALETYCYQSSKIVQQFAEGWYSKRNWQGEISEKDAKGFVAAAMDKLTCEIAREEEDEES